MLLLVATFSLTLASCSDNDEPKNEFNHTSSLTEEQIKNTFIGLRLDSIHSHISHGNIKLEYQKNLLVSYKECYEDGSVHDGVSFNLKYTPDTIFINNYKAIIGDNGLVAKLICPSGKVNEYEYDEHSHLIRYEVDVVSIKDKEYYEISWVDDNVISYRNYYQREEDVPNGPWQYYDVFYSYTTDLNIGRILPPLRTYTWINDVGRSVGYGINEVLYYAGLLGRGTKNLPKSNKRSIDKYGGATFLYILNDEGYVKSAKQAGMEDEYIFN